MTFPYHTVWRQPTWGVSWIDRTRYSYLMFTEDTYYPPMPATWNHSTVGIRTVGGSSETRT